MRIIVIVFSLFTFFTKSKIFICDAKICEAISVRSKKEVLAGLVAYFCVIAKYWFSKRDLGDMR